MTGTPRAIVLSFIFLSLFASCKREAQDAAPSIAERRASESVAPAPPGGAADQLAGDESAGEEQELNSRFSGGSLESAELGPFAAAADRTLEYSIALNYRVDNFPASRRALFTIARKYGYLSSSEAAVGERSDMNAVVRVRVRDLFQALDELDAIGALQSESIQTTDHTAELLRQTLLQRRENLRTQRRLQGPATTRSWADRERLISSSEDAGDQAYLEQWGIRDRAAWATLQVSLRGPEAPQGIRAPLYANAFIDLANLSLMLLYYAIYLLPLLIVLIPLWLYRQRLVRLFRGAGWN
ncbi:MAG: DUF4349 domain-containing protein [Leptospirales bacterium]|nr:DUF4349 domain-containing protein [Leptospirales bacterium]